MHLSKIFCCLIIIGSPVLSAYAACMDLREMTIENDADFPIHTQATDQCSCLSGEKFRNKTIASTPLKARIKTENQAELLNSCFRKDQWILVNFYLPNSVYVGYWRYSYSDKTINGGEHPLETGINSSLAPYFRWEKSEGGGKTGWAKIVFKCNVDPETCRRIASPTK